MIDKAQTQSSHPLTPLSSHTAPSQAHTHLTYSTNSSHKVFPWTKQNNLTLNSDKTSCTMFTPDPAEYKSNLDLKINNTSLSMATPPKVLGLTLDPKLTSSSDIHTILVQAHTPLQMIKALTATRWGKHKYNYNTIII